MFFRLLHLLPVRSSFQNCHFVAKLAILVLALIVTTANAQLSPENVLVLYNSKGQDTNGSGQSDSVDIFQYYQQFRPGVLGYDLNDVSVTPGNISYADYISKFRDPLRAYLDENDLDEQISVFTLTRGLPHRIEDLSSPSLGDQPGNATEAVEEGNASYATVDSELTVLWQTLEANEANGTMDSFADNVIVNPYHNSGASLTIFNRSDINETKSFQNIGDVAWRMRESPNGRQTGAGSIYLSSRLDGHSVQDVLGMIDRGQYPSYNQFEDLLLFDENAEGILDDAPLFMENALGYLGDDYDESASLFGSLYENVRIEETAKFLIGPKPFAGNANTEVVTDDVALLASYGGNHGGDATGYVESFRYSNGAIMNTLESFNARQLGGGEGFDDQGQLADFIATGGTFGIGQGWEPFAFSLSDNEAFVDNFLFGGLSWVESAWTGIPWLSWQQIVFGDPLAEATLIVDPQTIVWLGSSSASGSSGDGVTWGDENNWVRNGVVDSGFQHGDTVIFAGSGATITLGEARIVQSVTFSGDDFLLRGSDLAIRTGEVEVSSGATARIESNIYTASALHKIGSGTLELSGHAPRTVVSSGILSGTGTIGELEVIESGRVRPGTASDIGTLTVQGDYRQTSDGTLSILLGRTGSSQLVVAGVADVDGTIELVPVESHQPPEIRGSEQQFTIIDSLESTGAFDAIQYNGQLLDLVAGAGPDSLIGHVGNGLFQILNYDDQVTLTSYFAIPGDANGDQVVNAADLQIWNSHRFAGGTDWIRGDFNGDGVTDVSDFNIWSENVGTAVIAEAVPEPAASHLLILTAILSIAHYARRRRLGT